MDGQISQIGVEELALRLGDRDTPVQLIDVREPREVELAHIKGFEVLPLSQYEEWSPHIQTRFNPQIETLVMCHHGIRSTQMCAWLQKMGFTNVKNVAGGIDAYSVLVDPGVPRYY
jgi:rhodanese-related sulfurtransferase